MNLSNWIIGAVAGIALVLGIYLALQPAPQTPLGATPGNDFLNQVSFWAGKVDKGLVATSSQGSTITVTA